ncbi:TetR family transcriptional regulator [Streptomyces sp. NPDC051452]|uniref:TetR family transcriptional regulator n=1 Tax=Streptomyces sp. NPDC051452 TaxID=3365654 RepID=UPI0037A259D9
MAKQARSLRTHELVLDAAAVEFVRHGYPRANLQHVAARTGLTKGALYGHFASKEHLARALTEHLDEVVGEILARHTATDLPVRERLRALCRGLAERVESDVRFNAALRLVLEEAPAGPEPPKILADLRALATEMVEGAVDGAEAGQALEGATPAAALADLATVILVGAYCTAPDLERRGLAERVHELWDAVGEGPQAVRGTVAR